MMRDTPRPRPAEAAPDLRVRVAACPRAHLCLSEVLCVERVDVEESVLVSAAREPRLSAPAASVARVVV